MYYFWKFIVYLLYVPYRLVFWTRFKNKRELRKHRGRGVVFVCNHKSYGDPPLMVFTIHRRLNFPITERLMKKRLWRFFFTTIGCFPVKKGNDLALMRHCLGALKKNQAVFIFPEGRRVFNAEDSLALRDGASMIAIKAGVPVVPMVLKRAPRPFRFNTIKVGSTISTEEYQGKKLDKQMLADLSGKRQAQMADMLDGFEVIKQKKWEKTPSVIARGIVFIDGKLLVIKRQNKGQEYFVFPGGHLDEGESVRDCAVREVLEETGVECEPIRCLYKFDYRGHPDERGRGMQSMYLCEYKSGDPRVTDAEEYTDTTRDNGTYEPTTVDIAEIGGIDLRPNYVRDQLVSDIEKYGVNLARPTRWLRHK